MGKRRKRRTWSDDEKREICVQTAASGVSVAQVARRYALNANLIHNWLKDPRFAPDDEGNGEAGKAAFLPVEIEGSLSTPPSPVLMSALETPLSAHRVDITLSDGRRVLIEGPTTLNAVVSLVQGLAT
ncbi:MAG: transposase [Rhodobacteraceae bacterium]|nr:transposase [Paracoccaceae bacterium]